MAVLHRRADGSFVALINGMPYHVLPDDPLFPEVEAAAEGVTLPPEPEPPILPAPSPAPQPTPAQLMARLAEIQAQIELMEGGA